MKKMLTMLMLTVLLLTYTTTATADTYALTTVVTSLDYDNDVVMVMDFNGNLWSFEGCEDWAVYDVCSCMMDDQDTDLIYDDEIIGVRYDGWITGWMERLGY